MKLGDLKGALLDADFAIRDGENNAKALFRKGQVSFAAYPLLVFFPAVPAIILHNANFLAK